MALSLLLALAGCSSGDAPPAPQPPVTGADRDAQGCIGSAGYSWCEKEQACVRPWELAQQRGFDSTEANFRDYCSHGVVGHVEDEEGTKPDRILGSATLRGTLAGFRWGDYLHAEIRDDKGQVHSLFVGSADACFLALHAGEPLQLSYDRVSRYFEEGGGYFPAEAITQVKARGADFQSWMRTFDAGKNAARCEQAIEQRLLKSS